MFSVVKGTSMRRIFKLSHSIYQTMFPLSCARVRAHKQAVRRAHTRKIGARVHVNAPSKNVFHIFTHVVPNTEESWYTNVAQKYNRAGNLGRGEQLRFPYLHVHVGYTCM